jgi:3-dehydroquinate synthase
MRKVSVNLADRSYYIFIGSDILLSLGRIIRTRKLANAAYIITNKKIRSLYGKKVSESLKKQGLGYKFCMVADSEKAKSHQSWFRALKDVARFDKGKGVAVIALGGGVVGDLSGFVASSYRRGVGFIQVPTTLLGQVDSAIGGKVAIDIDSAKNIAGAFYQPSFVLSDISTLSSLPLRQIKSGLAEVIKYGVILDKRFFAYIEKNIKKILRLDKTCLAHVVSTASRLKSAVVSADEHEKKGYRSILNFGHTVGHAIEAASSYRRSINHGEAVAVGMLSAFDIAVELGFAKPRTAERLEILLKKAGLPVSLKRVSLPKVLKALSYDKKIIMGKQRWVLPLDIGHVVVASKVPHRSVKMALSKRLKK